MKAASRPVEDPCRDCGRTYTHYERVRWMVPPPKGDRGMRTVWEGCVDCWIRRTTIPTPTWCEWHHDPDAGKLAIIRVCLRWSGCWHFYRWSPACPEHVLTLLGQGGSAETSTECLSCHRISPIMIANVESIRGLHV